MVTRASFLMSTLGAAIAALGANPAYAWYGPFCYSSKARQVSLTVPTMTGEAPGDAKVTFDDNDGRAKLVAVRASTKVKNAHEIVLGRDDDSRSGVFAVIVTSGRAAYGYKFELEFRDNPEECTGAIIKVSDKFSGDIGGDTPAPAVTKPIAARRHVKREAPPVETGEAAAAAAPESNKSAPTLPAIDDATRMQPISAPSDGGASSASSSAKPAATEAAPDRAAHLSNSANSANSADSAGSASSTNSTSSAPSESTVKDSPVGPSPYEAPRDDSGHAGDAGAIEDQMEAL